MDFLDPQKQRAHQIRLLVGYVLLAIAVGLAATVLMYQARGFGYREGRVVQNGLVFVQSTPGSAAIDLNGRRSGTTNARLSLEAGSYTMKLSRNGYHDWQRALTVEGGSVEHFTYPFLVPRALTPVTLASYDQAPVLTTQSPDRRWLLVQQPGQIGSFDIFDAEEPEQVGGTRRAAAIPAGLFTLPVADDRSLQLVDWSNNNEHVIFRHTAGGQAEYILFAHESPAESVNLTRTLGLTPDMILSLQDKKYDRYFVHDTAARTLSTISLRDPQMVPMLTNVLAFKSYGTDTVLYTSALPAQPDRVQVRIYQDKRQHVLRTLPAGDTYLLGLSRYDNAWMVMTGVPAESRVYIYRNPVDALRRDPDRAVVPAAVLKAPQPSSVAFSANSQLMMAQGGTTFAVYDAEYDRSHTYSMEQPMDAPQTKAAWLDSHHLHYVSGGKALIFDYDGTNLRTLVNQTSALAPLYDTGYATLYSLAPSAPAADGAAAGPGYVLSATPLRTPADQ